MKKPSSYIQLLGYPHDNGKPHMAPYGIAAGAADSADGGRVHVGSIDGSRFQAGPAWEKK